MEDKENLANNGPNTEAISSRKLQDWLSPSKPSQKKPRHSSSLHDSAVTLSNIGKTSPGGHLAAQEEAETQQRELASTGRFHKLRMLLVNFAWPC